jgi:hypothetical protein
MTKYEIMVEIEKQFDALPLQAKLEVIEGLVRRIRRGMIDHAAMEKALEAMANDPDMLREMNVLPRPDHAAG